MMGDDAERAEDEYWANWGHYNLRGGVRRYAEERVPAEEALEEDWSEGGLVQRFPEGLTAEEISERITASPIANPIPGLTYWEMTPERRAGAVNPRLVAHRTNTNATWNLGDTSPQEGRQMFAGDPDHYGPGEARREHERARAVERARQEREAIEEAHKAKEANWRRAKIAARLREIMEGIGTDQEPDVSMDELEALGDYVTKRLTELKRAAQVPLEPDVSTDGPCVVTFSRSYDSGRTSYTYVALRIPNGPSAGMWTTTGHRVRNFLTWNELMEFAAGGNPDRPVVVQVVSGWTLL